MSLNTPLNPRKASASARFRLVDTIISRYGEADNKSGGQVLPANMYTQQRHAKNNSFAVTNYSQNAGQGGSHLPQQCGICANKLKKDLVAPALRTISSQGRQPTRRKTLTFMACLGDSMPLNSCTPFQTVPCTQDQHRRHSPSRLLAVITMLECSTFQLLWFQASSEIPISVTVP